jgi:hypothetical protein
MNLKTLSLKAAGGLFAAGVIATSFLGGVPSANAEGGATQTFSPICISKPDIRFDRVRVEKVYDQMVAYIHFSNQGCATQTSFPIAISESAPSYTQVNTKNLMQPAMAKGESTVRVVVLGPATSETHYLNVALDIDPNGGSHILESNEYNNYGDLYFQMP